jgi:ABC-type branched-subunit amino acid transport system substrate-binding protein
VQAARSKRTIVAVAVAACVVPALLAAPAAAQSGSAPGVTAKEIRIGAVIAKTNPTGIDYQDVVDGAQAYFDIVNKRGGVFGRKLRIVKVLDDQSRGSKNVLAARSLVEEAKVFAAFHASQEFSGADVFAKSGTPVFGYNIQEQWSKGPNFFGTYGSYICFDCPIYYPAFVASQEGLKRVGIFAYGSSPQSADCASATREAFDRWGPEVAVYDTSLSFGFSANDISGAVQAIKEKGVDFVTTCMDLNGVLNLKRALEAAGVRGVKFYAPQGYDGETLKKLGDELNGFIFLAQFTPFEAAKGNPGMTRFLEAMKAKGYTPNENYVVGWAGAALLVRGIRDAGKNFTQQSVVDAINKITDWTADGVVQPVDWTTAHGRAVPGEKECVAYVAAENGKFVPKYGKPGQPMVCISVNPYPSSLKDFTTYGYSG